MREITEKEKTQFQQKILNWYLKHKRNLPWRETFNPYYIHLSEIMLQQTQVERVKKYYSTFVNKYPQLEDLAKAPKKELLLLWQGLGYNNRILRLQQAVQIINQKYKGKYPETKEELCKLPGIGPYTAGAILVFAFNKKSSVVDTNIRRILLSEFNLEINTSYKELENLSLELIPENRAKEWFNALMDYGSAVLTSKKTGISSLSKQSKFEGSTRWVRSQILKELLKEGKISYECLEEKYSNYDIYSILKKMEKEQLLLLSKKKVILSD